MRILYVALTRAREKLIITGTVNDAEKSLKKWSLAAGSKGDKIPDYEVIKGRTFLDWICPAVFRHKSSDDLRTLYQVSDFNGALIDDESCWNVRLYNSNDIGINKEEEQVQDFDFMNLIDENKEIVVEERETGVKDEIHRRLSWEYKYIAASKILPRYL